MKVSKSPAENRIKAVSHELRKEALAILAERKASPAQIGRELGVPTGNVSYHVNKLVEWDCAEEVENRQVRGAVEHFFRATIPHVLTDEEWSQLHPELGRGYIGGIVRRLIEDAEESVQAELLGIDEHFHLTRSRHLLDEQGKREALEIQEEARLKVAKVASHSAERLADAEELGKAFTSAQFLFEVPVTPKSGSQRAD